MPRLPFPMSAASAADRLKVLQREEDIEAAANEERMLVG